MAVHGVVVDGCAGCFAGFEVGYDLVAEEVEVDPFVGAAAFGAGQYFAVEAAGGGQVIDGEGYVEGSEGHRCQW